MSLKDFGLSPNTYYNDQDIWVQHKNGSWYKLERTANKMLMFRSQDGEKRMRLDSLKDVCFEGGRKAVPKPVQEKAESASDKEQELDEYIDNLFSGGENNVFFDNDFVMAGRSDLVMDNDLMFD